MTLAPLQINSGYWYLGSPYSKYPLGMQTAYRRISEIAAVLINKRVPVFCPISHSHPIAEAGHIAANDHDTWLWADGPLMDAAHGLIVTTMLTWKESYGLMYEVDVFERAKKPVFFLSPADLNENWRDW